MEGVIEIRQELVLILLIIFGSHDDVVFRSLTFDDNITPTTPSFYQSFTMLHLRRMVTKVMDPMTSTFYSFKVLSSS